MGLAGTWLSSWPHWGWAHNTYHITYHTSGPNNEHTLKCSRNKRKIKEKLHMIHYIFYIKHYPLHRTYISYLKINLIFSCPQSPLCVMATLEHLHSLFFLRTKTVRRFCFLKSLESSQSDLSCKLQFNAHSP